MENILLVKLAGEISLKSKPVEKRFNSILLNNMRTALEKNKIVIERIEKFPGRFFIYCKETDLINAQKILQKVFGIHAIALAEAHFSENISLQELKEKAFAFSKDFLKNAKTFAVRCSRAGKHSFSSQEVNVEVGAFLLEKIPSLKVNLSVPQKTLFIEIKDKKFYFYSEETACFNGLPSGVEGNVGVFFEGKKEEAIACWMMLKRGCNVFPIIKKEGKKISSSLKKLSEWNSFKEFKLIFSENLSTEIKHKNLIALVKPDSKISPNDFQEFDALQELPVFRPLIFLPKDYLGKIFKLIEND